MKRPRGFDDVPEPVPPVPSSPEPIRPESVELEPPSELPRARTPQPNHEWPRQADDTSTTVTEPLTLDRSHNDADDQATQDLSGVVVPRAPRSFSLETWRRRDPDPVRAAQRRVRRAERARKRRERAERRRFSAHARSRRRNLLIVLGAVTGLGVFVAAGVFTPLMSVRDIQVVGTNRVPAQEITASLQSLEGTPLALVTDADVHEALKDFALLQSFETETIPPSTMIVTIREREPVLAVERGDELLLTDPAGVVIETVATEEAPEGLPLGIRLGEDLTSDRFRAAATVTRQLPNEVRETVRSVTAASPNAVEIVLDNGTEVMWGDTSEISRKVLVLESMLQALADVPHSYIDVSSVDAPVFR